MRELPGECRVTIEHDPQLASVIVTDARTGSVLEDVTVDGLTRGSAREIALALAPVRDTSTSGAALGHPVADHRCSSCSARASTTPDDVDPSAGTTDHKRALAAPLGATGDGHAEGRPARGRPARADRRHDRRRQVRAAADARRVARARATRRPGSRSCSSTTRAAPPSRSASASRTPSASSPTSTRTSRSARSRRLNAELKRREHVLRDAGAKDLMDMERRTARRPAQPRDRDRRVRDAGQGGAGVRRGRRRRRAARPQPRRAPRARHAAPGRRRVREHPRQRQPADRAADGRADRVARTSSASSTPPGSRRTTPGRALARVGQSELQEFQAAYVGGITTIGGHGPGDRAARLRLRPARRRRGAAEPSARPRTGPSSTDLEELVKAVNVANEREQHPAAAVAVAARAGADRPARVAHAERATRSSTFGVIDEPARQRRIPLTHDFENDGSMLDLRRQRRRQDGAAAHDRGLARRADAARTACTCTGWTSPPAA